jgi:hypothetical protein
MVGFHGVIALILQRIGANFIQQANVAAFLTMVQQDTAPLFGNMRQRRFELKTAITTQTKKGVAR